MKKIISILLLAALLFTTMGCVSSTNVTFYTDVEGAEVFVDGQSIGTTPITTSMSNAVWEDPEILIRKEGYKDLRTNVRKELKGPNVAFGVLLNTFAWLWCYGPKSAQNFMMIPN